MLDRDNDIIEISSSPEPPDYGRSPEISKSRGITLKVAVKGKGKASTPRRRPPIVVELTDSEPEITPVVKKRPIATPGSSYQVKPQKHSQTLQPKHAGPSRSFENIPVPSSSKKTAPTFFLPSDEENEPPPTHIPRAHVHDSDDEIPFPFNINANLPPLPPHVPFVATIVEPEPKPKAPPGFENAPIASSRKTAMPLFLPSDEENDPPAPHVPNRHIHGDDRIPLPFDIDAKLPPDPPRIPLDPHAPAAGGLGPEPEAPLLPELQPDIPADPQAQPEPDLDPASTAVAQVLEIIPNIDPDHLLALVETHIPTHGAQTVQHVLHILFEDPTYPKVDPRNKGKGKRKSDEFDHRAGSASNKKAKVDYKSMEREAGGPNYFELALNQLSVDFAHIPKPHLRRRLNDHRGFYAPTFFTITAEERQFDENPNLMRPYQMKAIRKVQTKGKNRMMEDPLFTEEKEWVAREVQGEAVAEVAADGEDDDDEDGDIECQCCFSEYSFAKMVQCPEAHLFCSSCVSTYASTKLGSHDASIVCMHSSGCILPFPVSELRRVLPEKLMSLYERVKQQKEVEAAGLEGLEECPFCEWKAVFEVSREEEKLFRCGNEEGGCGVVSCRGCKKLDHLPKSCKEAEDDKALDGQHTIEEAMTKALMRNCPKCQKAFIKDQGCNKMMCPNCHTISCYICRQVIQGYDHFNQNPNAPAPSNAAKKCVLWDPVEQRHAEEVKRAAEQAMEEYKRDHPEANHEAIKVDIPVVPSQPAAPGAPGYGMGMAGFGMAYPHDPRQAHGFFNGPPQPYGAHPVQPNPQLNQVGVNPFHRPIVHQQRHVAHQLPPLPQPQPAPRARARAGRARRGRGTAAAARAAAAEELAQQRRLAQQVADARREQARRDLEALQERQRQREARDRLEAERRLAAERGNAHARPRPRRASGGGKRKRG